jgi:predicted nucleic acid-binding protein
LSIVFEVYKFVFREASAEKVQHLLKILSQETAIIPIDNLLFLDIYNLALHSANWQGSIEDASVVILAQKYKAEIWTLDYRDLGYFKQLRFWTPSI